MRKRGIPLLLWLTATWGYFGPWVGLKPAALAWNAYDLFDLLRLLPEIETGALHVHLQSLRLPLVGLAVLCPWLLAEARLSWRLSAAALGAMMAVATLPPYPQIVSAWHTPGWCVPFWWGVAALLAIGGVTWLGPRGASWRPWAIAAWVALTGGSAGPTFWKLLPALSHLHATAIHPGWGFWMCLGSLTGLLIWHLGAGIRAVRQWRGTYGKRRSRASS